jgi:hypothetical protein
MVGTTDGFADRLRIVAVVLTVLPIRGDKPRSHELDRVTEALKAPRPFVRTRAGFHADQTPRLLSDEPNEPRPAHGLTQHHRSRRIDAV